LLYNDYEALILSNNEKSKGNILVTGVVKGQLQIKYRALNKKREKIDFDLATPLNEMLQKKSFEPGYRYFSQISSGSEYDVIEEEGKYLPAFIIEFIHIPIEIQDLSFISKNIKEACDLNARKPKIKKFPGICTEIGKEVIELTLECSENNDEWYPLWTNKSDHIITSFKYNLIVKNRYGQKLGRNDFFEQGNFMPGSTLIGNKITDQSPGTICYTPTMVVDLYEVEMELHLQTYDIIW
jgi:hypothetical protein